MTVNQLRDECFWFSKTLDPDLNVTGFDKSLGELGPVEVEVKSLEYGRRSLCIVTDVIKEGGFTDKIADKLFDITQSAEFNTLLEKQLQEDFGSYEFRDRLSAALIGVITSDYFLKLLKEKMKL